MTPRVIYDTMLFFQWAALPADRQHATIRAVYEGSVRLCISKELLDEVRDVLSRPELMRCSPNLTPDRLQQVLSLILERAEWVADVPSVFSWQQHSDDDHIFNLAIASGAKYLVTWESRILKLATKTNDDAQRLRMHAPQLEIITPKELATLLKAE